MLKIKDNVDLKELEKFGFRKRSIFGYGGTVIFRVMENSGVEVLLSGIKAVSNQTRTITISRDNDPTVLFDLIQAGLVEKVEE